MLGRERAGDPRDRKGSDGVVQLKPRWSGSSLLILQTSSHIIGAGQLGARSKAGDKIANKQPGLVSRSL